MKRSLEESACNSETWEHIHLVQKKINEVVKDLIDRGNQHDQSKLNSPEIEYFTEHTHKLQGLTYGSPEYNASLEAIKPALDHHYSNNRHHPQHYKNGIDDMNLIDLLEMYADWSASSKRHNDGNIRKSIEHNGTRFNMSPQLIKIFENTADYLE